MRFCHVLAVLAALVMGLVAGCGTTQSSEDGPPTEPVRGKIVFTKGGDVKSLYDKQARVEFQSIDQPGVRAVGAVEEDGSFTVATITPEGGSPGAVSGSHRVALELEDNAQGLVAPKFLDAQKSGIVVKVPSDGEIVVEVWR
jgi:hypothetical protein